MILSTALDEVLFWRDIDRVIEKIQDLTAQYYPHDPEQYFAEKDRFYQESIGSKEEFCRRLALYRDQGGPRWISSRSGCMDDLSAAGLKKAYQNISTESAAARAARWKKVQAVQAAQAALYDCYASSVLSEPSNQVLELTIGAGSGTCAVLEKMGQGDTYAGIDIDFRCAKTADGLGRYFGAAALGVCCNLWELPFDDGIFSAVCSNHGLEECREIPAILREAARVLRPGGKMVLACRESGYLHVPHKRLFDQFGFGRAEAEVWLRDVRLFANLDQLAETASGLRMTVDRVRHFDGGNFVVEILAG